MLSSSNLSIRMNNSIQWKTIMLVLSLTTIFINPFLKLNSTLMMALTLMIHLRTHTLRSDTMEMLIIVTITNSKSNISITRCTINNNGVRAIINEQHFSFGIVSFTNSFEMKSMRLLQKLKNYNNKKNIFICKQHTNLSNFFPTFDTNFFIFI